ncbi:hypothetical protein Tco_0024408 [Tanacetum coccineum]
MQVQVQRQVEREVQEHMRQRELEAYAREEAREREWQRKMDDINSLRDNPQGGIFGVRLVPSTSCRYFYLFISPAEFHTMGIKELVNDVSDRDLFIVEAYEIGEADCRNAYSGDQEELICYADAKFVKWLCSASVLQVLRTSSSIFTSVYVVVQKLKKALARALVQLGWQFQAARCQSPLRSLNEMFLF